jgi:hypothetical protein
VLGAKTHSGLPNGRIGLVDSDDDYAAATRRRGESNTRGHIGTD